MIPRPLLDLIRHFEGCKLTSYRCPAGIWTCGWGATGPDIGPDTVWTPAQAEERLARDAWNFASAALRLSPRLALDEARHAAIADFCFNLGLARYRSSTLKRCVDRGDWEGAARELGKWVWGGGRKLPGLVARRATEARILNP